MGKVDETKIKPAKPQPTLAERIEIAAFEGLKGQLGADTRPLYCLQFARKVVERAMGLGERGFYSLVIGVDSDPCAQELEDLLVAQRPMWSVTPNAPAFGDLLFWPYVTKDKKDWGHVGVIVRHKDSLWVAQNTVGKKGIGYLGALRLIKLSDMPPPRVIIRIGRR